MITATSFPGCGQIDGGLEAIAGPDALILRTPVETHGEDLTTVAEFDVKAGERIPFVLTWFALMSNRRRAIDPEHALRQTEAYWTALVEAAAARRDPGARRSCVR